MIRMGRNPFRFFVLVTAALLVYIFFPSMLRWGDWVLQTNPFSEQKHIELAFVATEPELACLNGRPLPGEEAHLSVPSDPIPNVVHFIFGLKNPLYHPDAGHFDFLSYLAVRSAIVALHPDALYLHYTFLAEPPSPDAGADPMTNPWIRRLQNDITLVYHPPSSDGNQYAHLSDTMRLQFLHETGGIYLDIDSFALRPFTSLLSSRSPHDVVLGAEGGNRWGLCNAVIAARANSSFVARWLESYKKADLSREWNYHSVILPKELAEQFPDEVCKLPPDAFFWPTWTWRHVEWMHEPLSRDDAAWWRREIERRGGSLFENQVAYHAWNQMSWERHLRHLTPELVRNRDTRFNLLMRRFLEDDL